MSAPKQCRCGCGQEVGPKANYRMGHDARHASAVARAAAERGDLSDDAFAELPSDALKAKAKRIAATAVSKSTKAKSAAKTPKRGRNV